MAKRRTFLELMEADLADTLAQVRWLWARPHGVGVPAQLIVDRWVRAGSGHEWGRMLIEELVRREEIVYDPTTETIVALAEGGLGDDLALGAGECKQPAARGVDTKGDEA